MKRATWNGAVLAESEQTVVVEGNHYFPPDAVNWQYLEESEHQTICGWKGVAGYYNVTVDGKILENAAWYYADPSLAARKIKDRVAFWKGVKVQ